MVLMLGVVPWCCCVVMLQTGKLEPVVTSLTELEDEQMKNLLRRVDTIIKVGYSPSYWVNLFLGPR